MQEFDNGQVNIRHGVEATLHPEAIRMPVLPHIQLGPEGFATDER
jgi:hypothetical protein